MARASKKTKLADLPAQSDPSVELDSAVFLRAAQPVLKPLESDLIARAKASPTVTAALKARHASEKASKRTADGFAQWQQNFIDQVAAAWLLSCVFVRTLEDRGLLGHPRIAGPGASDSQKLFFQMAPSLTERDYLLTVFRELTHFEAARDLFDAKHNPVWLLAPSAESAKALLALFRTPSTDTPAFRFGQPDTRFLGDLYQDLNERVRERYALLQTPRFVESFILDRTLERAIERFGLEDTTVIDPTCGSGHFLLGSFDRLCEHRLRAEPGLDPRQAAHKALDAVFGADINPYAVGIARFRLTLSFIDKAGFKKLADAPQLPLHLVVADSLLHNPRTKTMPLDLQKGLEPGTLGKHPFALDDPRGAREVLYREHSAVVGNPPYIPAKDAALRALYREQYVSAAGKFSLAAPFTERFFHLARERGYVGMITANSFMKREFGKKLIENYLPTVNVDIIVNTAGAYIPGHGTPTVLLFGTAEPPQGSGVVGVLANRGEPTTPKDPEQGHVWRSIADHWSEEGFENDYITISRIGRDALAQHPWSLSGGYAAELKARIESLGSCKLNDIALNVGISCVTGEDEVYVLPLAAAQRLNVGRTRPLVAGELVRDWGLSVGDHCIFPYDDDYRVLPAEALNRELRYLWPYRNIVNRRKRFGTPMLERGLTWYELQELYSDRLRTPLTIVCAELATHNHFVLDRGGKVFKRTAPIIKLPKDATQDEHFALLAYLNSSTACFWMKQVCFDKGGGGIGGGLASAEWEKFYVHNASSITELPIPEGLLQSQDAAEYGAALTRLAERAASVLTREALVDSRRNASTWGEFQERISDAERVRNQTLDALITVQEECDWWVYANFGLITDSRLAAAAMETIIEEGGARSSRPAIVVFHRGDAPTREKERYFDFTGTSAPAGVGVGLSPKLQERWEARLEAIPRDKALGQMERPEFKRTLRETWRTPALATRLEELVADEVEDALRNTRQVLSRPVLRDAALRGWRSVDEAEAPIERTFDAMIAERAVPFLACLRYSPGGLAKRSIWERTWELQREQDQLGESGAISAPPRFSRKDFKSVSYFRLRGKADVPTEPFISYPGCESDEDGQSLYGWAGWDHLQRMQALSDLYQQRKKDGWRAGKEPSTEGDKDDRLTPMLAGLLELLPWVKQWHNEPSEEFDGLRLGDYFERFINGECREFALTHEDLKNWRPSDKKRRPKKKRGS